MAKVFFTISLLIATLFSPGHSAIVPWSLRQLPVDATPQPTAEPLQDPPTEASMEPTSEPEPAAAKSPSAACFPAHATVRLSTGGEVSMKDLKVGDIVEVSPGEYSPVLLFTHASAAASTSMVVLESAGGRLATSATHFVVANGRLVAAGEVSVGDSVLVADGGALWAERVRRVSVARMAGLYNPQTAAGTILVRVGAGAPVLATTYTTTVAPAAARALELPLRALHRATGRTIPALSRAFPDTFRAVAAAVSSTSRARAAAVLSNRAVAALCVAMVTVPSALCKTKGFASSA